MARTNEERSRLEEAARKEVRFRIEDLLRAQPREDKTPRTEARRRSSLVTQLKNPENETETLGRDNLDDEESVVETDEWPSFDDTAKEFLRQLAGPNYKDERYTNDLNAFYEEGRDLVKSYASLFLKGDNPAFPFNSLTDDAKDAFPNLQGNIDRDGFRNLLEKPDILFMEFKLRTFGFLAYSTQAKELHELLKKSEYEKDILEGWVRHLIMLHRRDIKALATPNRPDNDDRQKDTIDRLMAELENATNERDQAQSLLADANQQVVNMLTNREGTPASNRTEGGTKRSAKLEVKTFYNDPKLDTVTFEVWLRSMRNRLDINHDWFANDKAKVSEIETHLGGTVAANLYPYLKDNHPFCLKTSEEVLRHLEDHYIDENAEEKSKAEYRDLKMDKYTLARFQDFKTEFVRLAGETRLEKSQWKAEFKAKLSPFLSTQVMSEYVKDSDFNAFAKYCSQMAHHLATNNQKKDEARKAKEAMLNPTPRFGSSRGPRAAASTTPTTPAPTTIQNTGRFKSRVKLTTEEMRQLILEGRCFTCKQKGHITRDCPHKNTPRQMNEAQVNAIINQFKGSGSVHVEDHDHGMHQEQGQDQQEPEANTVTEN